MKKTTVITIATVILAILGAWMYFVGSVSAVVPPIKIYEYHESAIQLIKKMKLFDSINSGISIGIGPTLGNKSTGYDYDVTININNSSQKLLYELKFEDINSVNPQAKVLLIGAHDLIKDKGGYGKNADGMSVLVDNFESNFLTLLKKNGINIDKAP